MRRSGNSTSECELVMSSKPFTDSMRVEIRDAESRLIRVLDLAIEPKVVLQGATWRPGVVVGDELDIEALEIVSAINESGFPVDADGVPSGALGHLEEDVTTSWSARRIPAGTPRPPLDDWLAPGP